MNEKPMIEPKEIEVGGKKFLLSKLPATAGREILMSYAGDGKGMTADSSKTIIPLLSYCSVKIGEVWVRLSTSELIDAHLSGAEALVDLEMKMLEHNFSFFGQGKTSPFSTVLNPKVG